MKNIDLDKLDYVARTDLYIVLFVCVISFFSYTLSKEWWTKIIIQVDIMYVIKDLGQRWKVVD
jgi:hypothetical protein